MKIGIDLRPFTTDSHYRGIGMYAKAFYQALIKKMPDTEFHYLNMYSDYEHDLPENERCILHNYYSGPQIIDVDIVKRQLFRSPNLDSILEAETKHFIKHSEIDIMFITSPLEYGNVFKSQWFQNVKTIGILYDLIPLLFPGEYLNNDVIKQDYYNSIEFVKKLDTILTLSNTSKNDAMRLLQIPEDKLKVVYSGISPKFRKLELSDNSDTLNKYGIIGPFIMYMGGIDYRKQIDCLIKAFALLKPAYKKDYQLIIVGNMPDYIQNEMKKIARSKGIGNKLRFTQFIPEDDLVIILNSSELLVYPSLYEGFGLPVIEAMACGTCVVTSNNSSLKEIARDYATLIDPKSIKSITNGISYTLKYIKQMNALVNKSVSYAQSFTWDRVADEVISILMSLKESEKSEISENYEFGVTENQLIEISKIFAKNNIALKQFTANIISKQLVILEDNIDELVLHNVPRILFEMGYAQTVAKDNYITGIGRTCTEMYKQFCKIAPLAAVVSEGKEKLLLRSINDNTLELMGGFVEPKQGDIYFVPELQLKGALVSETHPNPCSLREKGVRCFAVLYDIIPILMPQYFPKVIAEAFPEYIRELVENYDGIICDSKAVCDDLIRYLPNITFKSENTLRLGYSYLGKNIPVNKYGHLIPYNIKSFYSLNKNVFLMIGTIEPRKGHEFVLNAFEKIWRTSKESIALCILGKHGWGMEEYVEKIQNHPELGNKLLFITNAPDVYLQYVYKNSTALIQASLAEGFGLPIIEAAQYGLPVICTDIPVFHEVTNEQALFFKINNMDSIIDCINRFIIPHQDCIPDSTKIPTLTWEQSANSIIELIMNKKKWYARINTDGMVTYL